MCLFPKNVCIHFLLQVINGTLFWWNFYLYILETGNSTGEGGGILQMPSVPVRARFLVVGIANLAGLCGAFPSTKHWYVFCKRAHFMCLLLSCTSLTPTAVHSACVDGLHGHGNASTFSGPGMSSYIGLCCEVHVVWAGQLVLLFLLVCHKTHEQKVCYQLKLRLEYYTCSLIQGLLFPVPSLCIG